MYKLKSIFSLLGEAAKVKKRCSIMKRNCEKLMLFLFVGLMGCWLLACSSDEDETQEEPYLNVSPIRLDAKGIVPYEETFTVRTNLPWVVAEKPSWVELDVMEGNGEQEVSVSISSSQRNYRTGQIILASTDSVYKKAVEVSQNGNTLSAVTGDYISSKVTSGAFRGTDGKQYKYKHEITVGFAINGSHLASEYGVTGTTIKGSLSDGEHTAKVTLYSNRSMTKCLRRHFLKHPAGLTIWI